MNENVNHHPECAKCSGLCACNSTTITIANNTKCTLDALKQGTCACISCVLMDITAPLMDRFDQLLVTTSRMLELLEDKADLNVNLKEDLIDNYDLKEILKVKETKFFALKKLFKSYELENKPYYLQSEVLKVIRQHLLKMGEEEAEE